MTPVSVCVWLLSSRTPKVFRRLAGTSCVPSGHLGLGVASIDKQRIQQLDSRTTCRHPSCAGSATSLAGWGGTTLNLKYSLDTSQPRSGSKCLRIDTSGYSQYTGLGQWQALPLNTNYSASVWARATPALAVTLTLQLAGGFCIGTLSPDHCYDFVNL